MIPVYNMLVSLWREVPDCEELVGVKQEMMGEEDY